MSSSVEQNESKCMSIREGLGPSCRSLSTLAYMSLGMVAAIIGSVLARPVEKPVEESEEPLENSRRGYWKHGRLPKTSWRTVSLTSLSTKLSSGEHAVPSVSLRKWSKEHAFQHRKWTLDMIQGYDVMRISSWKPYFGSFKACKTFLLSKAEIRRLYPFKSKRPAPSLVSVHNIDNQRPCSIFSLESIDEFSNDSMFFSDPEFVSCTYSISPIVEPSRVMKNIPLNVYTPGKHEKRLSNNIYGDEKSNTRVDEVFDIINPLNRLVISDKEIYECAKSSNKQLLPAVCNFSDENSFDMIEPLDQSVRKNLDNPLNDVSWGNTNKTEQANQKKIFESFTSTNMLLTNERVPSFYSPRKEFLWDEGFSEEKLNETWDDDFDADLIIPIDIAKQQDTIKSHLGSIRKFASLIEDLKNLRKIAQKEGDNDEIWPEVEAIIALGTLENDIPDVNEQDSLNNSSISGKQDILRGVIMKALGKQFPSGERIGLDPDNLPGFVNYASLLKERCQGIIDPIHHTFSNINH